MHLEKLTRSEFQEVTSKNTMKVIESLVEESKSSQRMRAPDHHRTRSSPQTQVLKKGITIMYKTGDPSLNGKQSSTGYFTDLNMLMQSELSVSNKPEEFGQEMDTRLNQRTPLSSEVQLPKLTNPAQAVLSQQVQQTLPEDGPRTAKPPNLSKTAKEGSFFERQFAKHKHQRKQTFQSLEQFVPSNPFVPEQSEAMKLTTRTVFPHRGVGRHL